ncbi:hypothetical protein J1N35_004535 [Gossypium stocksii]|uniref:Uncharacterized protein n=1 Tax=Gossypium stocksii TaxID=47602 RepID=A0A9D3WDQ5_9ROSI|nr:hypothetical protein J1N35_004535 [Gossypium stocksii]
MVLRERGKFAKERYKRLLEEVETKNCKLENEKAKTESNLEILRKRFEELERVSCLETDFNTLQDEDDSKNNNGIVEEIGVSENGRLKSIEVNGHAPNAGSN